MPDQKPPPVVDEFPQEAVLYHEHPAMFRNDPLRYIVFVLLIPVFGIGLVLLFFWWLDSRAKTLIVTERRTILRKGIFSKSLNDIQNEDVRNIQVTQTFFQRLMGVGNVSISSAGQATVEIYARGMPDPDSVRQFINQSR
jgi:uncharacterized membrane protein YdbT with pleckstrin-like domain